MKVSSTFATLLAVWTTAVFAAPTPYTGAGFIRGYAWLDLTSGDEDATLNTLAAKLVNDEKMTPRQRVALNKLLFRVRDRIVDLMSEYRTEWRKRYGRL